MRSSERRHECCVPRKTESHRGGGEYLRTGFVQTQPGRAIVTNNLSSAVGTGAPDLLECGFVRPRAAATIGVPWVMVLMYAAALIGSSMAGLAVALYL